jgi:hypothetical protein
MNSKILRKNAVVSPCIITSFAESYGASRAAYDGDLLEQILEFLDR